MRRNGGLESSGKVTLGKSGENKRKICEVVKQDFSHVFLLVIGHLSAVLIFQYPDEPKGTVYITALFIQYLQELKRIENQKGILFVVTLATTLSCVMQNHWHHCDNTVNTETTKRNLNIYNQGTK